jgi:hypothetical protein
MRPSEMRAELLDQHEKLRSLIDELREVAARVEDGRSLESAMQEGLGRLAGAVREHNASEEALLKEFISTVDAWGPVRVDLMGEEHYLEHAELRDALHRIRVGPTSLPRLVALFERLLEHMEIEESTFLGEDVLKDDMVVIEPGA